MKQKQLDPAFVKERNAALFSLDKGKIEAYMKKYQIPIPSDEREFWGAVYKTIVNIHPAPDFVRKKAEKGLEKLGLDSSYTVPKVIVARHPVTK